MFRPPSAFRFRLLPIAIGQAFGVACGILGVKLNSRWIPPEVFGRYGIFLTLAPIGIWVVHAGLLKFTSREWVTAPSRPRLLRFLGREWVRRLPALALASVAAVVLLGANDLLSSVANALALFLSAAMLSAAAIGQMALQASATHWRDCSVSVIGSLSRTFLPPLLFLWAGGVFSNLLWGFVLHAFLFAAASAWNLREFWCEPIAPPTTAPIAMSRAYTGQLFVLLAAVSWVLAGMNRWLVAAFFGETEAGYFALAGGAAVVLSSTSGALFVQYFQPGTFRLADARSTDRIAIARRTDLVALGYTAVALAAIGSFALVAPELIGWLIDPRYTSALPWILPAGCFGVATIITVFFQTLLLAGRREKACAPVELSTAALLVLGSAAASAIGPDWFSQWLLLTPLVPWIVTRPLARHYLFKPDAGSKL